MVQKDNPPPQKKNTVVNLGEEKTSCEHFWYDAEKCERQDDWPRKKLSSSVLFCDETEEHILKKKNFLFLPFLLL